MNVQEEVMNSDAHKLQNFNFAVYKNVKDSTRQSNCRENSPKIHERN